jgi:hypothetical protein
MKGDNLQDLVVINSGQVELYPYLGNARWHSKILMENPPIFPRGFRRDRIFVFDVDGDGCADIVYLDIDCIRYWLNLGGIRFSAERKINYIPGLITTKVLIADLLGSGKSGMVLFTDRNSVFYLQIMPENPYLRRKIDDGLFETTSIEYSSSTKEALRDTSLGKPWRTYLPSPLTVVSKISRTFTSPALSPVTTIYE